MAMERPRLEKHNCFGETPPWEFSRPRRGRATDILTFALFLSLYAVELSMESEALIMSSTPGRTRSSISLE